jgi:phosphoribosylamine---glycine ligase
MKVLVVGSGGREDALAWKIRQSPRVSDVVRVRDAASAVARAEEGGIDLVVVQQDDLLAAGLVDQLTDAGVRTFGPTRAQSKIEWSKDFSKRFMLEHAIPTARRFTSIQDAQIPLVIKADGLRAGKGVIIAHTREEAERAVEELGPELVIEEFLEGTEVSIHAFCDGKTAKLFPVSRDHKRIGEGNTGPNTGGMGTIAPVQVSRKLLDDVLERVVMPVVRETGFMGVLFPGLMLTKDGYRVLEYNARFGDPETESYVRLLDSDLVDIMEACVDGILSEVDVRWSNRVAVTIMLASKGYPGEYQRGAVVTIPVLPEGVKVFRAGVQEQNGQLITTGGRVLGVSAVGTTLVEARASAYAGAELIQFDGKYYRKDIGA